MEQGEYRSYRAVHPFDERFGVDTSGLIYELPSGHQHDLYNNGYFAVAPSVFHAVMQAMRERLQSGLSSASASWMWDRARAARCCWLPIIPSARSLGSSFLLSWTASPGPTSRVIAGARHRPPVISMQGDAAEFPWPPGPLIVYMWNAFTGPVMERVFQNLEASLAQQPRELYLVYIHPELESMLDGVPWLNRLVAGRVRDERRRLRGVGFSQPGRDVCGLPRVALTSRHQSFENQVTISRQPSNSRNRRVYPGCYDCLEIDAAWLKQKLQQNRY